MPKKITIPDAKIEAAVNIIFTNVIIFFSLF